MGTSCIGLVGIWAVLVRDRMTVATEIKMITIPRISAGARRSFRMTTPIRTAMTGLTKAYVETLVTGTCFSR